MRNRNVAADPQRKAEALQLAAEHGPAEASRRTGVPAGTIRAWRTRAGQSEPPVGDRGEDWRVGRERTAHGAAQVAREAIEQARRDIRDGKPLRAQQSMTAAGIAVDKLTIIENQLAAYEERQTRLSQGQAEVVVEVLRLGLQAAGIPTDALRGVFRELFEQAGRGGPLSVSPAIGQPASVAVLTHFERITRVKLEAERKALAAPEISAPDNSREAGADGVVVDEPDHPGESLGEEVAEAEVVADGRSIEERAKELADRVIANMAAEQAKQEGFGVGRHPSRAGGFDIDDPAASIMRGGPQRWS